MGKMNLLKASWDGRVGETVGAKWKNRKTIRTYAIPSNPKTAAQQAVRGAFKDVNSFVSMFSDQIRYLNALDTAGMSVRNAIVKLNSEMIASNDFSKANLLISKGGLQKVIGESGSMADGKVTISWTKPTATNFTSNAKLVAVLVQEGSGIVEVIEASATAETLTSSTTFESGSAVDAYVYYLDKRGSNKVASESDYLNIAYA